MKNIRNTVIAAAFGLATLSAAPVQADVNITLGDDHYHAIHGYYGSHRDDFSHGPSISVTIGDPLPDGHEIHDLPPGLHATVPHHEHYGYYSTGEHLYVVRKKDRKIMKEVMQGG